MRWGITGECLLYEREYEYEGYQAGLLEGWGIKSVMDDMVHK